jgi:hypothetical protein
MALSKLVDGVQDKPPVASMRQKEGVSESESARASDRERARARKRERKRPRERETLHVCVCGRVMEGERARGRL